MHTTTMWSQLVSGSRLAWLTQTLAESGPLNIVLFITYYLELSTAIFYLQCISYFLPTIVKFGFLDIREHRITLLGKKITSIIKK